MAKNDDEEKDLEIPRDEDENVGDGTPKKKREKKRKSKEERAAERRTVFWTLLIVLIITLGFWLMPTVRGWFNGQPIRLPKLKNNNAVEQEVTKPENKNYMEITL